MTNFDDIEKEFDEKFVLRTDIGNGEDNYLSVYKTKLSVPSPKMIKEFYRPHLEAAYNEGLKEGDWNSENLMEAYRKGYERGASDMREKVIAEIESKRDTVVGYTESQSHRGHYDRGYTRALDNIYDSLAALAIDEQK